jgi:RNA polymerase sigma-70 factor (ECF subfamily)
MDGSALDFEEVYDAYQPRILRYLTHMVGEAEAEDLTQEVFVRVSRALTAFRGDSQLSTWLYRIATNGAIDRLRMASSRGESGSRSLDESAEIEAIEIRTGEQPPSLEQELLRRERYECFIEFVRRLPANYRTVIVLSELEGLANPEIAEILGLSLDAVKIRLHRARARLFQQLRDECDPQEWL